MDFETYIQMGGYALNVWGAYGLTLVVYIGLMAHAIVQYDHMQKLQKQDKK